MTQTPQHKNQNKHRASERGSALVYILIAIALLAALTVTFMEPSSQQTTAQNSFRSATAIQSQADLIRSAIQECVLRYSNGDQSAPTGSGDTEDGANNIYPLDPNSSYLATSSSNYNVREIRCPGNEGASTNDHVKIFTGQSGKFLPSPPDLFEEWNYHNGPNGVFYWTETTNSDSFLRSALEKLDDNYSECEADIIDATGSAVNLTDPTESGVSCPSGSTCFRIWMITTLDSTTVSVHQDHDGTTVDCQTI